MAGTCNNVCWWEVEGSGARRGGEELPRHVAKLVAEHVAVPDPETRR